MRKPKLERVTEEKLEMAMQRAWLDEFERDRDGPAQPSKFVRWVKDHEGIDLIPDKEHLKRHVIKYRLHKVSPEKITELILKYL